MIIIIIIIASNSIDDDRLVGLPRERVGLIALSLARSLIPPTLLLTQPIPTPDTTRNPHQDLQAMDRCHRIGQQKPVLVIRLATTHSVEGKLLRRANSKLMLERLVIKKGAFIDVGESKGKQNANMGKSELMDILRSDISLDDVPQSGEVDDAMMDRILERQFLLHGAASKDGIKIPYPESGRGYEVVRHEGASGGLMGSIL